MKLTSKLTITIIIVCCVLLAAYAVFSFALYQRSEEQNYLRHEAIVSQAISMIDQRVAWISSQMTSLAVHTSANMANLYAKMGKYSDFIEYGSIAQNRLGLIADSMDALHACRILMLDDAHEITSHVLYEKLTPAQVDQWRALLREDVRLSYLPDEILLAYPLSSSKATGLSYVVSSFSVSGLLRELLNICGDAYNARVYLGDELLMEAGAARQHARCLADYTISKLTAWPEQPLRIVVSMEKAAYGNSVYNQFLLGMALYILIFLICMLLMIALCRRLVYHPLQKLLSAFNQLAYGNTAVRIHTARADEFGDLYANFNQMTAQLEQAIEERTGAELKRLQGQINPHFLHNAFYQIYRMCKNEDTQGAAEMTMQLFRFYEYVNDEIGNDQFISLESEYQHALTYCAIQQLRFEDRFVIESDINPGELAGIMVPSLILQPVLENAFTYLADCDQETIRIRLSMTAQDGRVFLAVEDNGDRLTDERLAAMRKALYSGDARARSSLNNIHARLRMAMGEPAGLELSRSALGGLKVLFVLSGKDSTEA